MSVCVCYVCVCVCLWCVFWFWLCLCCVCLYIYLCMGLLCVYTISSFYHSPYIITILIHAVHTAHTTLAHTHTHTHTHGYYQSCQHLSYTGTSSFGTLRQQVTQFSSSHPHSPHPHTPPPHNTSQEEKEPAKNKPDNHVKLLG